MQLCGARHREQPLVENRALANTTKYNITVCTVLVLLQLEIESIPCLVLQCNSKCYAIFGCRRLSMCWLTVDSNCTHSHCMCLPCVLRCIRLQPQVQVGDSSVFASAGPGPKRHEAHASRRHRAAIALVQGNATHRRAC